MDYEKKYKKALELARVAAFNGHQSLMEGIFPELKESEDERIKEALIEYFRWNVQQILSDFDNKEVLAWLENIPYTIDHEKREGFHLGYKAGLEKQGKEDSSIQQAYEWGYTEGKRIERKHWVEKQKFSEDYNSIDPQFGKPIEQNPAWSEEDENVLEDIEEAIINYWHGDTQDILLDWLNSLKQRIKGE